MPKKRKLPLKAAYTFAHMHGVGPDAESIKLDRALTTRVRRERIVRLFEERELLSAFGATLTLRDTPLPRSLREPQSSAPECFEAGSSEQGTAIAEALRDLTRVQSTLRDLGAIRSQRVVGDLGEWLASQVLQMAVCANPVQTGWDLAGDGIRVQVKSHAKSPKRAQRTNLKSDAVNYDGLAIVALTNDFRLRAIYLIPLSHVVLVACNSKGRRIINWTSITQYEVGSVPTILAPILSTESRLVANDDQHREELSALRTRIRAPAA